MGRSRPRQHRSDGCHSPNRSRRGSLSLTRSPNRWRWSSWRRRRYQQSTLLPPVTTRSSALASLSLGRRADGRSVTRPYCGRHHHARDGRRANGPIVGSKYPTEGKPETWLPDADLYRPRTPHNPRSSVMESASTRDRESRGELTSRGRKAISAPRRATQPLARAPCIAFVRRHPAQSRPAVPSEFGFCRLCAPAKRCRIGDAALRSLGQQCRTHVDGECGAYRSAPSS